KSQVMEAVQKAAEQLAKFSVKIDTREEVTPGFKFNDWELKGVPVRMEIGPKDVQNSTVAVSRRDIPGKAGKSFLPMENLEQSIGELLDAIHENMLARATQFRDSHIFEAQDYDSFKQIVADQGWAVGWWSDDRENEARIKEETKATLRIYASEPDIGEGVCFYSGKRTQKRAYFARSY
ncbi:MAG TPA: His/Gly/Thr/Pro-type tRNA ligase C-terminal domain-containing protein, partial [Anaerolineaceae bacterium]|nr:His/Gly/Thr/Pro-type tRNA ligase C-terminal domain-containing protein [Anaerolineaceae bacterium]